MQTTVRITIDVRERPPRRPSILVLSDDQEWRSVVQRVLEQQGYDVTAARHAGQALVAWMRHEGRIDLLLTEGAHGRELADVAPRISRTSSGMRWVHLDRRPSCGEELLAVVTGALSVTSSGRTPRG